MGELTYEQLFDMVRKERSREEIQECEEDFFLQAQAFLSQLGSSLQVMDPLSAQADKLRTTLSNAKRLLSELYTRREKKIVLLALNKARTGSGIIDTSDLLNSEKQLYESMVSLLLTHRNMHTSSSSKPSEITSSPQPPPLGKAVRITSDVPKFLGANKQSFGPYAVGEQVELPEKIASILVKKGRAELT